LREIVVADENELLRNARALRSKLTYPERKLWYALRDRRLAGVKFRRQAPLLGFIVDFLCLEHSLVIELDGNSHIDKFEYDSNRHTKIEAAGYRVIRFSNDDVLRDIEWVLGAILLACGKRV
jgi:very-short-patch-repair endonuclease